MKTAPGKTDISVILPCRNEEKTLASCINKIHEALRGRSYEIIVSDSSSDRSPEIARKLGAKLVKHDKKGYGIAYHEGFAKVRGDIIVMGDADDTYDFRELPGLLERLKESDLVIGRRKRIMPGAMPPLHRYIGNPVLSCALSLFFGRRIHDAHSGLRVIRRDALEKLELRTTGMEFASEMIIRAMKLGLRVAEVPITYHRRQGTSKLNSFSDGWRHLRFMLMYAPDYMFLLPGFLTLLPGLLLQLYSIDGTMMFGSLTLYTSPMVLGSFLVMLGMNIIILGVYAKTYAVTTGFEKRDALVHTLASVLTFERGVLLGGMLFIISAGTMGYMLIDWVTHGFFGLATVNPILFLLCFAVIGVQIVFSSVFLSILLVETRRDAGR